MKKDKKCPWWHPRSFRSEEYSRARIGFHEEPKYTKWYLVHYCYFCRKEIKINKLEVLENAKPLDRSSPAGDDVSTSLY